MRLARMGDFLYNMQLRYVPQPEKVLVDLSFSSGVLVSVFSSTRASASLCSSEHCLGKADLTTLASMQPFVLLTMKEVDHVLLNPNLSLVYFITRERIKCLTTDDAFWHCLTLAAFYQLVQSVLQIGSVLAERVGQWEVGGCTPLGFSAWWLLELAVEKPWSELGGPFACFRAKTGIENTPFTL